MAVVNFSPLLGLALPTTGDLAGTWGNVVNDSITGLLDSAVAGTTTLSSDADVTLSTTTGAPNQARNAVILWTATGSVTRNITAPAQSKAYVVINATGGSQSIVIRGAGPTTGVTVAAAEKALVAWNGSDFVKISSSNVDGVATIDFGSTGLTPNTPTSGAVTVAGTLAAANGGTGQSSYTTGDLLYSSGSTTLSKLGVGAGNTVLTSSGSAPQWSNSLILAGSLTVDSTTDSTSTTTGSIQTDGGVGIVKSLYVGGPSVISVNSGSDALRITQTGAGNALVVEDSANPDSTPFVIDANGVEIVGAASAVAVASPAGNVTPLSQQQGNSTATTAKAIIDYNVTDDHSPHLILAKSGTNTVGAHAIVANGEKLAVFSAQGSDGANFIRAAEIAAYVDGTPGTNDMPGRLVLSTTRDGASSPTEAMRIDNVGRIAQGSIDSRAMYNIGQHNATGTGLEYYRAGGTIPSTGTSYVIPFHAEVTTPASATTFTELAPFRSQPATTGANSTITYLEHFSALGPSLGAGASITTQYGFSARSSLTSATNNYGFHSDIASGTGRWNFYAKGTADNYFAGSVGIGVTPNAGETLNISKSIVGDGSGIAFGVRNYGTIQSSVTNTFYGYISNSGTAASAFTLSVYAHFAASQGSIGAGSTVTNQYGFLVSSNLTGATNNYGFLSNIASGTGRWNFYAAGSADNYLGGSLALGGTATPGASGQSLRIGLPMTGVSNEWIGILNNGQVKSGVTTVAYMYRSVLDTEAAAFTLNSHYHYHASQASIGAGSAVTEQFGFAATSSLTGATNNYGFYSSIASGTGRWNFYASGSAANYFAGDVKFGSSVTETVYTLGTSGTIALNPANGTIQTCAAAGTITFTDSLASGQSISLLLTSGSSFTINWPTITWVTSAGNTAPTLTANDTLVFWKISTTLYGAYVGSGA